MITDPTEAMEWMRKLTTLNAEIAQHSHDIHAIETELKAEKKLRADKLKLRERLFEAIDHFKSVVERNHAQAEAKRSSEAKPKRKSKSVPKGAMAP